VAAHIAAEPGSELAAVTLARGPADLVPAMPGYVTAFLTQFWG
jgi:hypothetical protein